MDLQAVCLQLPDPREMEGRFAELELTAENRREKSIKVTTSPEPLESGESVPVDRKRLTEVVSGGGASSVCASL